MKENRFLESMGLLDDEYVEEARGSRKRRDKRFWIRVGALAACACIILTSLGLWLFLPFKIEPDGISEFADSPYFSVISKLETLTRKQNGSDYKNNFDKLFGNLGSMAPTDDMDGATGGSGEAPKDDMLENGATDVNGYVETTDNQVNGVIEADIIKRSTSHIFYLRGKTLSVYNIAGESTQEVGTYTIEGFTGDGSYLRGAEMYLSKDCKTVTVLLTQTGWNVTTQVHLVALDVSDPTNITQKNTFSIRGNYLSSRSVNGDILLLTDFLVSSNCDFSKEEEFLPQIDTGNGMESIPPEDIIAPDVLTSTRYTVVSVLGEDGLTTKGCSAFLSYSQEVYVSQNSIYLTRAYNARSEADENGYVLSQRMTEIYRLHYAGESLEYKGSVKVAGYVNDQYSLDEYNGILRVVTTTSVSKYKETSNSNGTASAEIITGNPDVGTNASLYCIDLATLTIAAQVEKFAPRGEVVQSVRFDKDTAYVCTSVQLTDPVFFFDLSDLTNITYKDTGTIAGFSSSLVNFGEGFLLGIGRGDGWDTVKIEVYEEGGDGVVSVDSIIYKDALYSTVYKSYFIDREKGLVGMGLITEGASKYVLIHFDGYELNEIVNTDLGFSDYSTVRAVLIDTYLYIFTDAEFKVVTLN